MTRTHSRSSLVLVLVVFISGIVLSGCSAPRKTRVRRQNMKVRINATEDTIVLKFLRPDADTKLEGYILGYGSSIFSKQFIQLPENGEPYETEIDAEPKYLIAVRPMPNNEVKRQCTGKVELQKPLHLVIGSVSPTSVLLSWGAVLKTPYEGNIMDDCQDDGHFTVRYREKNRRWNYQTCPTRDTVIDKLRPNGLYEFCVQPNSKDGTGMWSKPVVYNISRGGVDEKTIRKIFKCPNIPVKPVKPGPRSSPFAPRPVHHNRTQGRPPFSRKIARKTTLASTTTSKQESLSTPGPTPPVVTSQPIGGGHLPRSVLPPFLEVPLAPKLHPLPQITATKLPVPVPQKNVEKHGGHPLSQPKQKLQSQPHAQPKEKPQRQPHNRPKPKPQTKKTQTKPLKKAQPRSKTQPKPVYRTPKPQSTSQPNPQNYHQSQPQPKPLYRTPKPQPKSTTQPKPQNQPQSQPQLKPIYRTPKPQSASQPNPQNHHQSQPQPKTLYQTPKPQPKPTTQPKPQNQPQSKPQPKPFYRTPKPQPPSTSQPKPQSQPQLHPKPLYRTTRPQPISTSQPKSQNQPQSQPQTKPLYRTQKPQLKSRIQPKPQNQPQPKPQPKPLYRTPKPQPLSTSQPRPQSQPQPQPKPLYRTPKLQPQSTSQHKPQNQPQAQATTPPILQTQPKPTSLLIFLTKSQPQITSQLITNTQPQPQSTSHHIPLSQPQPQPTSQPIFQTQPQPTSGFILLTQPQPQLTTQHIPPAKPQHQLTSSPSAQPQPQPTKPIHYTQPTSQPVLQTQPQPTSELILLTQPQPQLTPQHIHPAQPQYQLTSTPPAQPQPQRTKPIHYTQPVFQPVLQTQPQLQSSPNPDPQSQPQTTAQLQAETQPQPTVQHILQTLALPKVPIQPQTQPQLKINEDKQSEPKTKPKMHFPQPKPKTLPQPKSQPKPKSLPQPEEQIKPQQIKPKSKTRDQEELQPKIQPRPKSQPPTMTQTQPVTHSQPIPLPSPSPKTQTQSQLELLHPASRPQPQPQPGLQFRAQTRTHDPNKVTPRQSVPTAPSPPEEGKPLPRPALASEKAGSYNHGTGVLKPSIADVPRSPISSSVPPAGRNTTLSHPRVTPHSARNTVRPLSTSKTLSTSLSSSTPGDDGVHHKGNALLKPAWSEEKPAQHPPIPVNKRPNLVGKPSDRDKPMDLKQGDKETILKPFALVTAKPKQERQQKTTTSAPAVNNSRFDINDNSSIFRPLPTSDIDVMGKKRFVAPHVIYKTDKKPNEPCSITSSLTYFPDEEGNDLNVTSPPRIPPSNVTVVTVEGCPSFVILDWQTTDNETTEFEVESTTKGPNGKEVSVVMTNQTHTAVENLNPESSYEFKVTPKNELGTGPSSDPVSFSTESADPRVSEHVPVKAAIWSQFPFQPDAYSECNGKMFVKRTWYRKFVGIQLCNSLRYQIYLSDSLNGKFYNIGDLTGYGEDHCQFVDSFLDGRTGIQMSRDELPSRPGFYRAMRQEPVSFGNIGGTTRINYVGWYECGKPIPGRW